MIVCSAGTSLKCNSKEVPGESFSIEADVTMGSGWAAVQFGVRLTAPLVQRANADARLDISLRKVRADCRAEVEVVEARANARIDELSQQVQRLAAQLEQVISAVTSCPQLAGPTVSSGTPLLLHSIEARLPAAVDYLVERRSNFDPNERFSHPSGLELSPFLLAVAEGNMDLSLKFIALGADIQDRALGATALQLAARSGCFTLVEHLVSLGAVITGKDFIVPQGEEGDKISGLLQGRGSSLCTRMPPYDLFLYCSIMGAAVYDAAQHGWDAASFHRHCDNKGALVFMMTTTDGTKIGAYASCGWNPSRENSWTTFHDDNAFLFEITESGLTKIPLSGGRNEYACHGNSSYGPTFGGGHDLFINNNPHQQQCKANVGHTYSKPPSGFFSSQRSFTLSSLRVVNAST